MPRVKHVLKVSKSEAKIIMIPKAEKSSDLPTALRPISLLPVVADLKKFRKYFIKF